MDRLAELEKNSIEFTDKVKDDVHALAADTTEVELEGYAARRHAEQSLAHKWLSFESEELKEAARKMLHCRSSSTICMTEAGEVRYIWDEVCGLGKICPDEGRKETQRVVKKYVPELRKFAQRRPTHRLFYAVFTQPNFSLGSLKVGMDKIMLDLNERVLKAVEGIPEEERTSRKATRIRFPQIKGALTTLEAPLSEGLKWNVHVNAILMVDGRFDYKEICEAWGHNVEIRELKETDEQSLGQTIQEVLKYSVQLVTTKSASKRERHATNAPAFSEWTEQQTLEWWKAMKGFRRTRSYGEIYALEKVKWNNATQFQREKWLKTAGMPQEWATMEWLDIPKDNRKALKEIVLGADKGDPVTLIAIGRAILNDALTYSVDLIKGNNFFSSTSRKQTTYQPGYGHERFDTGPPGYH